MSGPRHQLAVARQAIAALCERMGLDAHAGRLRLAYVQNSPDEARREFASLVSTAGLLHRFVEAFHMRMPKSADIGELVACALVLETESGKAIALCDRVISERAELAALGAERPVLGNTRRVGGRAGDDR